MRKLTFLLASALVGILLVASQAYAATGLSIQFNTSDATPIEGVDFQIYQVSTYDADDDYPNLVADGQGFENYVEPNDLSKDGISQTITALAGYVQEKSIEPTLTGTTDASGNLSFSEVPTGIYLVTSTPKDLEPTFGEDGSTTTRTYSSVPFLVFLPEQYSVEPKPILDEKTEPASDKDPGLKVEKILDTTQRAAAGQYVYKLSVWNPIEGTSVTNLTVEDKLPEGFTLDEILSIENATDPVTEIAEDRASFSVSTPELPYGVTIYITYRVNVPAGAKPGDYVNVVNATDHDKLHDDDTQTVTLDNETTPTPEPDKQPEPTPEQIPQKTPTQHTSTQTTTPAVEYKIPDTGILAFGSICIGVALGALGIKLAKNRRDNK